MALYWKRYVIPSYSFTFTLGHYNYTLFLIKCSWTPQLLNYHINTDDFILILKNKHDIYKKTATETNREGRLQRFKHFTVTMSAKSASP